MVLNPNAPEFFFNLIHRPRTLADLKGARYQEYWKRVMTAPADDVDALTREFLRNAQRDDFERIVGLTKIQNEMWICVGNYGVFHYVDEIHQKQKHEKKQLRAGGRHKRQYFDASVKHFPLTLNWELSPNCELVDPRRWEFEVLGMYDRFRTSYTHIRHNTLVFVDATSRGAPIIEELAQLSNALVVVVNDGDLVDPKTNGPLHLDSKPAPDYSKPENRGIYMNPRGDQPGHSMINEYIGEVRPLRQPDYYLVDRAGHARKRGWIVPENNLIKGMNFLDDSEPDLPNLASNHQHDHDDGISLDISVRTDPLSSNDDY